MDEFDNDNFIVLLFTNHNEPNTIENFYVDLLKYGEENRGLINATELKKMTIIDIFFKKKIKDKKIKLVEDNDKFLYFIIERSAISLK
jgi:hypothetical protein